MRNSLFVKLLVAFALVVLVGTALMTFLANRAASGGLTLFVDQSAQTPGPAGGPPLCMVLRGDRFVGRDRRVPSTASHTAERTEGSGLGAECPSPLGGVAGK